MAALSQVIMNVEEMFHEKQHLMHCAIHTLNNLFQEPWANAAMMEDIARQLFNREAELRRESGMRRMWVNPYKSVIPQVGYYDINVLLEALKLKECHVSRHAVFNSKDPNVLLTSFQNLDTKDVRGIVINRVSMTLLGSFYTIHHYYAIIPWPKAEKAAETEGTTTTLATTDEDAAQKMWYKVDSKSAKPEMIGGIAELAMHLAMEAREHQGHIFIVSNGLQDAAEIAIEEIVEQNRASKEHANGACGDNAHTSTG